MNFGLTSVVSVSQLLAERDAVSGERGGAGRGGDRPGAAHHKAP